jgi:hypothetical protein
MWIQITKPDLVVLLQKAQRETGSAAAMAMSCGPEQMADYRVALQHELALLMQLEQWGPSYDVSRSK